MTEHDKPPSPDALVDALQDRITPASGPLIRSVPIVLQRRSQEETLKYWQRAYVELSAERIRERDTLGQRINDLNEEIDGLEADLETANSCHRLVDRIKQERCDQLSEARARLLDAEQSKALAYAERNKLVRFLSQLYPAHLALHPDDPTWDPDWRHIVCIHAADGVQMAWHIRTVELTLFNHLEFAPNDWDGHTTEDKYEQLAALGERVGALIRKAAVKS